MTDPAPLPQSPSQATTSNIARLLLLGLAVLFAAGLVLAYSVDPPRRAAAEPATATPPQPIANAGSTPAAVDAAALAAARQRIEDLERSITALQASHRTELQAVRSAADAAPSQPNPIVPQAQAGTRPTADWGPVSPTVVRASRSPSRT
jgi:hypothetical protein